MSPWAVIPDADLRERFEDTGKGLLGRSSRRWLTLRLRQRSTTVPTWLDEQNAFLAGNAETLARAVAAIEGVATTHVEGT